MTSLPKLAITTAVLVGTTGSIGDSLPSLLDHCTDSWAETANLIDELDWVIRWNTPNDNLGVTSSLQWLYEHTSAPVIAFLHSDCEIFEKGWDERVLLEFDDPRVGVVGFGGALQLGEDGLYKTPYRLTQLRRIDYMSNTRDAETHGERFTGACDVATLDGFALIVRREMLDKWSGWPVERYPFHNYDNALCVHAHKNGWRVRLVGIDCQHHGGATATTPAYQQWSLEKLGMTDAQVHEQSHLALYEDGRGVLPWRVR